MRFIVIVLHERKHLEPLLEVLEEAGMQGITVLESFGLVQTERHRTSLVGGARRLLQGARHHSKTIFGLVKDAQAAKDLRVRLEAELSFESQSLGYMVSLLPAP